MRNLEVVEGSRGRTPTVALFNPNAELNAIASKLGRPYTPKKAELALEKDLEMLPMAWTRKDDVVLVSQMPRLEHLTYLRNAGVQQPEWVIDEQDLSDRKLGGMRPWAWSNDADNCARPLELGLSACAEASTGHGPGVKTETGAKPSREG